MYINVNDSFEYSIKSLIIFFNNAGIVGKIWWNNKKITSINMKTILV